MAPGASYEVLSVLAEGEQSAAEWVMQPEVCAAHQPARSATAR